MARWVAIGVAVAVALTLGMLSADLGHAKSFRKCGDVVEHGAGVYDVRAHNVSCKLAKRTANRYWHTGKRRRGNWKCKATSLGYELARGKCFRYAGKRRQAVRFLFGA